MELMFGKDWNKGDNIPNRTTDFHDELLRRSGVSKDEINLIAELDKLGSIETSVTNGYGENFINNKSFIGKVHNFLMVPFKMSERAVRMATALSLYEGLRKSNPDMKFDDAVLKIDKLVRRTHQMFGKEGTIGLAKGDNDVSRSIVKQLTLLSGWTINQNINYMKAGGEVFADIVINSNGLSDAAKRAMKSTRLKSILTAYGFFFLIGGMGAMPFARHLIDLLEDDKDPDFINSLNYSDSVFTRLLGSGLPALIGIDNSYRGFGFAPGNIINNLKEGKISVSQGVFEEVLDGLTDLAEGDVVKGSEKLLPLIGGRLSGKIIKNIREATQGVTTKSGKYVTNEDGTVRKRSISTAISDILGIRISSKFNRESLRFFTEYDVKDAWIKAKQSVQKDIRDAMRSGDMEEATELKENFNKDLAEYRKEYNIKPTSEIKKVKLR
jgi:hypothetical protein